MGCDGDSLGAGEDLLTPPGACETFVAARGGCWNWNLNLCGFEANHGLPDLKDHNLLTDNYIRCGSLREQDRNFGAACRIDTMEGSEVCGK